MPPLEADGEGAEGHLTHKRGILSYPEICSMLSNPNNHGTKGLLRKVNDPSKKLGDQLKALLHKHLIIGVLRVAFMFNNY